MSRGIVNPVSMLEKPKEILILNLLEHISILKDFHLSAFVEPKPGLYISGSHNPVMKQGRAYYFESEYMKEPIQRFEDVFMRKETVVDEHCNSVISQETLIFKESIFSTRPSLPTIPIKFLEILICNYIRTIAHKSRLGKVGNQYALVREEFHYLIEDGHFDEVFHKVLDAVYDFIGDDTWFIYNTRLLTTSLVIEKIIDYRIYDFHCREYDKYLEEQGEPF